jgi:hypothetical protein
VPDLQQYSDEQLKELVALEVGDRKKAIAEEILRRRRQQRRQKWLARNVNGRLRRVQTLASRARIGDRHYIPVSRGFYLAAQDGLADESAPPSGRHVIVSMTTLRFASSRTERTASRSKVAKRLAAAYSRLGGLIFPHAA